MHRLLKQQLKCLYGKNFSIEQFSAGEQKLVEVIENTYIDNDKERKLLEHVLELSSQELKLKNRVDKVPALKGDYRVNLQECAFSHLKQVYKLDSEAAARLVGNACTNIVNLQNDFETALQENNNNGIQAAAHSIKGVASNLGLMDIAEPAEDIAQTAGKGEQIGRQLFDDLNRMIALFATG